MEPLTAIFTSRISRMNLDTTKNYIKIVKNGDISIEEPVGRFVKAYTMGSGDGMAAYWEFTKDGITMVVCDQMWGPFDGAGLIGFKEDS